MRARGFETFGGLAVVASALSLVACGGGGTGGGPTGPSVPSEPTYSLTVTVYYDENLNGKLDPEEAVRVPGVDVEVGTGRGTTAPATGQATVTGIHAGAWSVTLRPGSLPAFFESGPAIPVQVPGEAAVSYPVTLPIGNNRANVYLGLGDSITVGDGSSDGNGYGLRLQDLLGPWFRRAEVHTWGREGDFSVDTADPVVMRRSLRTYDPAYTLVLLGTNDWQNQTCQKEGPAACFTIDALRSIVEQVKDWHSLPVLGTIPPVNPALAPAGRNTWIDDMNTRIRALAQEQGALLADVNGAFKAQGSLPPLFFDDVHPSDAGYQVLAQAWFDAITRSRDTASSRRRTFGFFIGS
jgi:lysophospholipase L1-like esterase